MIGLYALVVVLGVMGIGTISNQLRLNGVNAKFAAQARNGQLGLNRTCRLLPVSKKLYADMLERGKITPADYDLVVSTASAVCP